MARTSLADRLQAGFEALPANPGVAHPVPKRRRSPRTRTQIVLARVLAFASLAVFALMLIGVLAYVVGSAVWWRTSSVATCTVTDFSREYHAGKGGPGVVWTVDTENCGPLQITTSPDLRIPEADAIGDTMWTGDRYRFDLRGFAGWPGEPKAIVAAKDLTQR